MKIMNKVITLALALTCLSVSANTTLSDSKSYLGFRHNHNGTSHKALNKIKSSLKSVINKGRVNVYEITDSNFSLESQPQYVQDQFFVITEDDLNYNPIEKNKAAFSQVNIDSKVTKAISLLDVNKYKAFVTNIVAIGNRSKGSEASAYLISELQKQNVTPIRTDYNIVSKIQGTTDKSIVVIGHMDTVRRTVGADDNASGASGVLELSRVLSEIYKDEKPKASIYFVLSEDEEDGLLGAKRFVKKLKKEKELKNVLLSINMDMIAYNSNKVLDLETSKANKPLALEFAKMATTYTELTPNLVLNPWGSDHVPFLDAGVPALLTIENWKTHTPCWHKSCDTLDTLNFEYAIEILKVNLAMILERQK
jgi:hypothetical protein